MFVLNIAAAQNSGDIRLVDYTVDHHSGRLELYVGEGVWSTVCYNKISPGAAQAACRQLGYSDYERVDTVTNMG
jgi:hypothetical protein